jgi:LysR family hydrogen peroxide-inducible transcriptional activator
MPLRRSSLPFVPFTLGVGLLSRVFGGLGDKIGALLIAGPAGAALAYVWTVDQTDEGLASGINNAAKRIAQLAAVTLAAGVASFASGYEVGLIVAAATSIGGAFYRLNHLDTARRKRAARKELESMEFNQIRYFLNLADTLNFTEAAIRSGVSQPTLTRAIQRLEQELGGTLVYRDGKDSRLTALGRDIRSEFTAIAEGEQRVRALSLNRIRGRRETLTLGVVNTIAPALITGFVTHALRQMPMLELVLQPITRDEGMELLLSGQIDGCFCTDPIVGNAKIATVEIFHERLLLAMALGHPLASEVSVSLSDLSEQPYLDRLQCEFRTRVMNHLGERAIIMIPRLRSEREDLIQQAVAQGAGVCMLPERSAIVDGLTLRPVDTLDLSRTIAFQSISGSGTAAALRQLRMLVERYAWS